MDTITQLGGLHHVTAITSSSSQIYDFYTLILGMRMVKKNVNQDDLTTYHLYFADDRGNPGTNMTFFDFRGINPHKVGNNDISRTSFRVKNDLALEYWLKRFKHYQIKHGQIVTLFGRKMLRFEDFDAQQYALFSDENVQGVEPGKPWQLGPVPDEFAIIGLGPIFLRVSDLPRMRKILINTLKMRETSQEREFSLFSMGQGGNGASVIVEVNHLLPNAVQGYGGVHHVAFRVKDREELTMWEEHFNQLGLANSGFVERYYFGSVYIRLYPNILFELATDGPGFIDDEETYEILGEKLTLPSHLRKYRSYIEKQLPPFDTIRSTKKFPKEYL